MKARRFEEVLDECLSAYLDGRRTIEESLSLYPDLRPRLEPLLRTATELADRFGQSAPPPHIVERGRQRFLESADIRRRARELTLDIPILRRMANVWGRVQWGALAGSIVALFLVVSFTATALDSGSRETSPQAQVILDPRPPAVTDLRETQEQLRVQTVRHGSVSRSLIEELTQTTAELQSQVQDFDELDGQSQREIERAIGYQYLLLRLVIDTQPRAITPEAREALDQTRDLAEEWGVDLPDPVATASATPLASPSTTPAGSATPGSSPGGTPTSTPEPSLAPTPTPMAPSPDTLPLP